MQREPAEKFPSVFGPLFFFLTLLFQVNESSLTHITRGTWKGRAKEKNRRKARIRDYARNCVTRKKEKGKKMARVHWPAHFEYGFLSEITRREVIERRKWEDRTTYGKRFQKSPAKQLWPRNRSRWGLFWAPLPFPRFFCPRFETEENEGLSSNNSRLLPIFQLFYSAIHFPYKARRFLAAKGARISRKGRICGKMLAKKRVDVPWWKSGRYSLFEEDIGIAAE